VSRGAQDSPLAFLRHFADSKESRGIQVIFTALVDDADVSICKRLQGSNLDNAQIDFSACLGGACLVSHEKRWPYVDAP
jgi:hypothetical protein